MRIRSAVIFALLALSVIPACALSLDELDIRTGLILIGTAGTGATSPSPIVPVIGAGLPIGLSAPFYMEPMLDLFGTYYHWTGTNASPAASEAGDGFYTVGILTGFHGGVRFDVTPALRLGGSLGLDFLIRFPFEFQNTSSSVINGMGSAFGYFFSSGRFFYPETRFFLHWQLSDPLAFGLDLRAFYPLFHLWDGMSQSFFEQFMLSAGIGFDVKI
jgi:hypothetical protein